MNIARFGRRAVRRSLGTTGILLSAVAISGAAFTAPATAEELTQKPSLESNTAHAAEATNGEGFDSFIVSYKEKNPERVEAPRSIIYEELYKKGMERLQERQTATDAKVVKTDKKLSPAEAEDFMNQVRSTGTVEYIEPDVTMRPMSIPNDPYFDRQWSHNGENGSNVDLAWDIAPAKGEGEVVAVIDSGITEHPDLRQALVPGYDFVSDPWASRDHDGRDNNPQDEGDWYYAAECNADKDSPSSWHGTHVAGIIAATANNREGIAGVAPNAQVQPVRALGKCGGRLSDIADAVVWASGGEVPGAPVNRTPAKIINMSLGGQGRCSRYYQEAIDIAVENGATVLVAAGNENQNADNVQPASCNNGVTIGATGDSGARAGYSNYGRVVDVTAPGGDMARGDGILSTLNSGQTRPGRPNYAFYQGTSMATPLVAGTVAPMRSVDPSLTPDRIERILKDTTYRQPVSCPEGCGTGIVDAEAAVRAVGGRATRPTTSAKPTPAPNPSKLRNPFYDYFNDLIGR